MESEGGCAHVVDHIMIGVDDLVVPNVDEHLKPHIGMVFNTLDEVELFYKKYGKAGGFDVRRSTTNFRNGELIGKIYVCSKEGESKGTSSEPDNVA